MVSTDTHTDLDGLDVSYTIVYKHGTSIGDKQAAAMRYFQQQINRYQASATLYDGAALASSVAAIQSGLVV
jgi:hypothetical protein